MTVVLSVCADGLLEGVLDTAGACHDCLGCRAFGDLGQNMEPRQQGRGNILSALCYQKVTG